MVVGSFHVFVFQAVGPLERKLFIDLRLRGLINLCLGWFKLWPGQSKADDDCCLTRGKAAGGGCPGLLRTKNPGT